MVIDSVVCAKDVCEVVNVTMFWDALGEFECYKLEKGISLEKVEIAKKGKALKLTAASYKAVPFTEADNKKLNKTLRDKYSALKTRTLKNLTKTLGNNDNVDFVASPTPPNIKDAVVNGAALTCFHLWHWANGDISTAAKQLTHKSCDKKLLSSFLSSKKQHYVSFALEHLRQHKLFSPKLVKQVNELMRGGNNKREYDLGYAYLQDAMPDKKQFLANLAVLYTECDNKSRIHLLELLKSEKELPDALIDKMATTLPAMKSYYELDIFLKFLEKHAYVSPAILTMTAQLLEDKNFFIARRAYSYLKKQTVDEKITKRIQVFREKSKKEGRILR